jgi:hypothetical protein
MPESRREKMADVRPNQQDFLILVPLTPATCSLSPNVRALVEEEGQFLHQKICGLKLVKAAPFAASTDLLWFEDLETTKRVAANALHQLSKEDNLLMLLKLPTEKANLFKSL